MSRRELDRELLARHQRGEFRGVRASGRTTWQLWVALMETASGKSVLFVTYNARAKSDAFRELVWLAGECGVPALARFPDATLVLEGGGSVRVVEPAQLERRLPKEVKARWEVRIADHFVDEAGSLPEEVLEMIRARIGP